MKRVLSLVIIAALLICSTAVTVFATSLEELQAQQEELEAKSAEYQRILNEKNSEVSEQQDYVDALVGKVQTVNEEITVSHQKINALDEDIKEKQGEIDAGNQEIEKNMNILRQRIKTIYIAGDVSSLEIILGAKDFSDFLDKVQLVKSVSAHDEELIAEIQGQLEVISEEKAELETEKGELEEEQANLETKQAELNTLLEENKETLATLQAASDDAQMNLTLTEEQLAGLSEEIQEYYRQQREAQQSASSEGGSSSYIQEVDPSYHVDVPAGGGYVWPTPGFYTLTSSFEEWRGYRNHGALDIAGGGIMGTPVVAAASGTVIATCTDCSHNWGKSYSCGCGGGYGNYVWISHGNGKESIYAHLTATTVSQGATVSAGQLIGYVGSTGYSTGAHLHFECRYNGNKYDPMTEY
ncbi:MAG: peptidoglycan DD-metalloendopeptidase family protein [Ruminococcus sp.]|nr:peptidoglycan DD-metalloendopeptidase family protein [Ruminococcus sp.]